VKTRLIWAVAALAVVLGQSALADDGTKKVRADKNQVKNLALPSGFKTAQGFAAVDANKGVRLTLDGPATAAVARDSVNTTH
jgi:hypothetical protein